MPKVDVYNLEGKQVSQIELSDAIFGIEPNAPAMHQVIVAHLAKCRQGTQSALTRSEVSGGGKKPWKQKGTGHARQGSTRAPQWRHGGMVFAVKPRDYTQKVNKKVRRLAMKSAFSSKVLDSNLIVLEGLELAQGKTRELKNVLSALNVSGKALIVTNDINENLRRAAANLEGVKPAIPGILNVYDLIRYDKLVITADALKKVEEVYV
ncbi:MAG: 50S ribosomal protein L4 [Eubacteriales bacterium]|nr:50S ribosomal protein L4 [Eubacteriales bacterium]